PGFAPPAPPAEWDGRSAAHGPHWSWQRARGNTAAPCGRQSAAVAPSNREKTLPALWDELTWQNHTGAQTYREPHAPLHLPLAPQPGGVTHSDRRLCQSDSPHCTCAQKMARAVPDCELNQ